MNPSLDGSQVMAASLQWEEEHALEAKEAGFAFLEATGTSLTFQVGGMLFQLIMPEAFLQDRSVSEETFVAMNLDNSAPGSLLMTINEKLERLCVGNDALGRVLDVFSQTVIRSRRREGGPRAKRIALQSDIALLTDAMSTESTKGPQYGSDDSSTEDNEKGRDSDDEYFFTHQVSDDDHDDFVPDECGDREILFYLERVFKDGSVVGRREELQCNGYLNRAVREAKQLCEEARKRSSKAFSSRPATRSFCGSAAALYEDDILQFCDLSLVRVPSWVQIRVEACGIVNDGRVAAALGFSLGETLQLFLNFDGGSEAGSDIDVRKGLEVNRVIAKLQSASHIKSFAELRGDDCESSLHDDRSEFEEEHERLLQTQEALGYGVKVLLPELVRAFFRYKSNGSVSLLRSKPWQNTCLDEALQYFAAVKNPVIGLICFLGTQLRALPSWCAVCWSLLPVSVERLRTCQDDLCLYEFEELGLGATIHQEIQDSPEVVQFELSLACAAASATHRDVFEPFPAFFLSQQERRGRSGWFTTPTASHNPSQNKTLTNNKKLSVLSETLQSLPKLEVLKECADESSLKRKLSKLAFSRWKPETPSSKLESKEMSLPYDLMRFILSTNRLSLSLLRGNDQIDLHAGLTRQFVVLHDSPEKEAIFEERRNQNGSFFAFHGSGLANWYSIMRNGLRSMSRTQYMSTGAAFGDGIYLGKTYGLSHSYAMRSGVGGSWKQDDLQAGTTVVALCEVINGSAMIPGKTSANVEMYVVPAGKEDNIALRYLLVSNESAASRGCTGSSAIHGTLLHDSRAKQPVNLREHYDSLRRAGIMRQQIIIEEQRLKAFSRLKRDLTETEGTPIGSSPTGTHFVRLQPSIVSGEGSSTSREIEGSKACRFTGEPEMLPTSKRLKEAATGSIRAVMTPPVTQAIMKEFRKVQNEMRKAIAASSSKGHFADSFLTNITVDIPDEANLHIWHVGLHQKLFQSYAKLYKDLQNVAISRKESECFVHLEVTFPDTYPFAPPFIRVVRPRFVFHTGHVTVGGSICMELLTESGWLPSFSFESVLVQIVNAFVEGEGRIDSRGFGKEYSKQEAKDAFVRVANQHGWKVTGGTK